MTKEYLFKLCRDHGLRLTTDGTTIFASPKSALTKEIAHGIRVQKINILKNVPRIELCGETYFVVEAEGTRGAFVLGAPTLREFLDHHDLPPDEGETEEGLVKLCEDLDERGIDEE